MPPRHPWAWIFRRWVQSQRLLSPSLTSTRRWSHPLFFCCLQIDLISVRSFAARVVSLAEYRQQLMEYLRTKMASCAPNLSALIGEQVGAAWEADRLLLLHCVADVRVCQLVGWGAAHLTCGQPHEPGQIPGVYRANSGCREGAFQVRRQAPAPLNIGARLALTQSTHSPTGQGAENQGQHAQIWAHLPLQLHRACWSQEQGQDIPVCWTS